MPNDANPTGAEQAPATQVPDPRLTIAYEHARAMLAAQNDQLRDIRTRSVSLLTIAALLVSFSGALGLVNNGTGTHRSAAILVLAGVIAITFFTVIYVLWPSIGKSIDTEDPLALIAENDQDEMLRKLISRTSEVVETNRKPILYRARATLLIITLVAYTALSLAVQAYSIAG